MRVAMLLARAFTLKESGPRARPAGADTGFLNLWLRMCCN